MNFIEQLLGISPDGGSGSWEFQLFALLLLGVALAAKCGGLKRASIRVLFQRH